MKLQSTFAILDVKRGRQKLLKKLGGIHGHARIPITITGFITNVWGHDDDVSQEFSVEVTRVKVDDL